MKKIFFMMVAIFAAYSIGFTQSKIPVAVTSAFNQKFASATNVKWEKENAKEYEAEFVWNNVKYSANFSETGEWLETETSITFDQLPEKVKQGFGAIYKGAKAKEVSKIETSDGKILYEIEFKNGIKSVEVLFDGDGTEVKK